MGAVSGWYFEDQVSTKAWQLVQRLVLRGIGTSESVVTEMGQ